MQKHLFITYIISALVSLTTIVNLVPSEKPPTSFINSIEDDISGDGLREYMKLQGELLSDDSGFYQNVWLEVTNQFAKEWTISLKGGYQPKFTLYDITQDKVNDIVYQVALDEEGERFFTQIYTITNDKVEQVKLPENKQMKGKFMNDFRIAFTFHPNDKPIHFPINNNKQLIESDIYNQKGSLTKEVELKIDPIKRYQPTLISKSKGHGLKSAQDVRSNDSNEAIGTIETLWYFNKNKWIILKNEWIST